MYVCMYVRMAVYVYVWQHICGWQCCMLCGGCAVEQQGWTEFSVWSHFVVLNFIVTLAVSHTLYMGIQCMQIWEYKHAGMLYECA